MNIRIPLFSAAACLMFVGNAAAQLMPHDNWRVSGVEFGSPTNNNLRSIAIGSGGVYVAEVNGGNPTQVLQFTEAGAFVRRFSPDFGYIHGIACDAGGQCLCPVPRPHPRQGLRRQRHLHPRMGPVGPLATGSLIWREPPATR